eukprot:TRINITY_DN84483_c0_g1_i1.p1 TRINITY_DN84483_c0_g1~~TRINITY_DN84483_c0_g1_i1.p1  ORF type:complete len:721 (-),score=88.01 TRINITY_DN84483_c0_g1_i1:183-2345(-)
MASKASFESMKASWTGKQRPPSPVMSDNTSSPVHSPMQQTQQTTRKSGSGSPNSSGGSPSNSQRPPSPSMGTNLPPSPRQTHRRSYGADAYSHDYVKKQSLMVNTDAKDAQTTLLNQAYPECDARSTLATNGVVWVGERDGSITIRRTDGEIAHIIERRQGAFVWCMIEVGECVWAGCSDGFIRVLSCATYRMERQFSRHAGGGGGVNALCFHAPSNTVFSGGNDFEILAWDATTCDFLRQMSGHGNAVRALACDTHRLYSGSDDATVMVWDIASGQKAPVAQWGGHAKGVHSLCVTDQHVWSGSEDATIRIWRPADGECIGVAEVHTGPVQCLLKVGDRVWSGAGDTVCVWDATHLSLLGTYVAHNGYLSNIVVLNKTTQYTLWTTASDRAIRGWRTEAPPAELVQQKTLKKLAGAEAENAKLAAENAQLRQENALMAQLRADNAALANELAQTRADAASMANLVAENAQLKSDNVALAAENAKLRADNVALVADNTQLRTDNVGLGTLRADLQALAAENAKFRNEIAALRTENGTLQADNAQLANRPREMYPPQDNTALLEELRLVRLEAADLAAKYRDSQARLADLANENHRLATRLGELEAGQGYLQDTENAHLRAEMEAMSNKLREMDIIFKSRLSLITEVFKVYKRFEGVDKRLKQGAAQDPTVSVVRDEVVGNMAVFKSVISNHYSDDELAHLGSSRHFFPATESSPARNRSP